MEMKTSQMETEIVWSSNEVRPCNMAMTSGGRMFVTINPLTNPETKVYEVLKDKFIVYPNEKFSKGDESKIEAILGIHVDSKDNLWMLDLGSQRFFVWDTNKEKLIKEVLIPSEVVLPTSFMQDFVLDEANNRIIIADMTQGDLKSAPKCAFIVINLETGKAERMAQNHKSMLPDSDGGFALNPIAIDPSGKWIYFGALNGRKIYRVLANSFESEEQLLKDIEYYSPKSYSDGIAVDQQQNVYVTNIEENVISVSNPDGFKTIASLPKGQSWPDGLCIHNDGYVYCTVDQLNRVPAMNNGKDDSQPPYMVVRVQLVE